MQSWGDSSRFTVRQTRHEPTKSGVIGLLAAAQGRRRSDPIEDLVAVRFGVRIDQAGHLQRDFQTAHHQSGKSMPLSNRYYLADAIFLVGIETDPGLIETLESALRQPAFPLYLGRRSCPPGSPLVVGVQPDLGLSASLRSAPWQAADWHKRMLSSSSHLYLEMIRDRLPDDPPGLSGELVRDLPISYSPESRNYGWRTVVREAEIEVVNDLHRPPLEVDSLGDTHDPFTALEDTSCSSPVLP
jgi:CRISPR system Cascade subunit CasD